ncbi:hypothetical protein PCH_Pc20g06840 [Penicillium rubens Wisconsin 54-1255]|uniref:Uncharacterized protein n=1 Tax=Penicillium rubens (strain ATCC 28089 / DSM 1075 / NRRL 1951 / Wisconsin 54-1255) TaxID=500485 RepID=B6HDA9_PENRW|nr:hypothetical protein PCH_Pc20g06840 [Penicillium rubens Wisconsin 54-1255]
MAWSGNVLHSNIHSDSRIHVVAKLSAASLYVNPPGGSGHLQVISNLYICTEHRYDVRLLATFYIVRRRRVKGAGFSGAGFSGAVVQMGFVDRIVHGQTIVDILRINDGLL